MDSWGSWSMTDRATVRPPKPASKMAIVAIIVFFPTMINTVRGLTLIDPRQLELMRKLGLRDIDWRSLTAATVGIGAIWVLWLLAQYWPRRVRRDALDQQWHRLCKKLAARGLPRHSWESPSHYAQRITQTKPELIALLAIAERYAQLRFGPRPATDADIMKMKRAIKKVFQQ